MSVTTRSLHDGWTLRPADGPVPDHIRDASPVPASVPGVVHTDLVAAGLIPDPYLDDNEALLAWVGLTDWVYETSFDWTAGAGDRRSMVWHGLDTVATVELNGALLLEAANQHRTHVVDVTDRLVSGTNTLTVRFASAVRYADAQSLALGTRPHVNHHPYNAVRKMACNFGWDWGPDLVTAGIWKPVELVEWSTARLSGVRPTTSLADGGGRLQVALDLEHAPGVDEDLTVRVSVTGPGATGSGQVPVPAGATTVNLGLDVPDAQPWWPRSHGDQPLSDVVVELVGGRGDVLADWRGRVGFRDVEWRSTPDEAGTAFTLLVNGELVFVRGVNWIPDDAFPHRVDRARYARRLEQATDAGVNLVRVWGGGIYEADAFYDECDERGLLVWQDFLFACACYAEEEPLRSEIVAEVRDNVTRLSPHPSLVLWNGGNENLWGFVDWEWEVRLDGKTWGEGYYSRLLPELLAELDPARSYVPGSPFSPVGPDGEVRHPNDDAHGLTHVWDVWNERDYLDYRAHRPRFASEFGWQGPPAWSTLRRSVSDDPLTPESPGMLVHQKAMEGQRKLERGLVRHLPVPDDMRDWHWAMSLNQARAVGTAVEHLRALSPHCSGSIVWQLNDCWPVTSWSAVDGDGRAKPTLYALRHAHADRLVTVQPRGDDLVVVVVNDHADAVAGELVVRRLALDGSELATVTLEVRTGPRSTWEAVVPTDVATPGDQHSEMLLATLGVTGDPLGPRGFWWFGEDRDLALPADPFTATVTSVDGGYRVDVTATGLVKDLALLADGLDSDAVVDDMLLTLLPGEQAVLQVRCGGLADAHALLGTDVLRCANDLLGRPGPSPVTSGAAGDGD
ncbi:glycoside hydrolase family 2 protein [Aquipuribacter sp. MA13-13]|uniref:glycoside hydrolase family 2 protein n=1 Tax=Aquipuribacter sp. MA13-13 TaxID=3440840 RepID=UPI003EEB096E